LSRTVYEILALIYELAATYVTSNDLEVSRM